MLTVSSVWTIPYDAPYSTKDDERDMRVQGKAHVPNTYMTLADPFPCARACVKTLTFEISNKGRLQTLICNYLTDLAQGVNADIIYLVGSNCTNMSTQQPMQNYSFDKSEADTVLLSGYSGPVVINAADTDAYVAAAVISQQLPGTLCIKRKQQRIFCRGPVTDDMADCILQLYCMPTQTSTVRVRNLCMTRWRRTLWHDGSCRSAARALTLRSRLWSSSSSSQDM